MTDGKIICLAYLGGLLTLYFSIYLSYTRNNYFSEFVIKNKNEKKEKLDDN